MLKNNTSINTTFFADEQRKNVRYPSRKRKHPHSAGQHREPNKKLGVLRDEIIWYTGYQSVKKYPGELRLIEFMDEESGKTYQFITNNFRIAASSIAEIYKQRW